MSEKLIVAISADVQELKKELAKANGLLTDFTKNTDKVNSQGAISFDKLTSSVKGLAAGFIGLAAAQRLLATSFQNSLKMDSLTSAFGNIFGSTAEGEKQFERLRKKANELGLEFTSLADSYKLFAASTLQAGMSIRETNRIFDSVSKAASALKLSAVDSERALRALAQMMSKGTVSSEELKQQLGDAMPGAFGIFAKSLGYTTQELMKMLDTGKILASDALPKFATELEKTFGKSSVDGVKGLTAEWNRLQNAIFSTSGAFSKLFEVPLRKLNEFIDGVKGLYQLISNPVEMKANDVSNKLTGAIDKTNTEKGLNSLILKFTEVQSKLKEGTYMWRAYTDAIIQAGAKIKELNNVKVKFTISKPQELNTISTAAEQVAQANELYDIYSKYPKLLSTMGNEYVSNPFFRDLINKDLQNSALGLNTKLKGIQDTTNGLRQGEPIKLFTDEEIANVQNVVNLIGSAMTSAFDAALTSGESFGKVLLKALGDLVKKMIAAIATATALSAILQATGLGGVLGVGGNFAQIFKGLTGFNLAGGGAGNRVLSPSGSTNVNMQGTEFMVRGNNLVAVLNSTSQRNNRTR